MLERFLVFFLLFVIINKNRQNKFFKVMLSYFMFDFLSKQSILNFYIFIFKFLKIINLDWLFFFNFTKLIFQESLYFLLWDFSVIILLLIFTLLFLKLPYYDVILFKLKLAKINHYSKIPNLKFKNFHFCLNNLNSKYCSNSPHPKVKLSNYQQ